MQPMMGIWSLQDGPIPQVTWYKSSTPMALLGISISLSGYPLGLLREDSILGKVAIRDCPKGHTYTLIISQTVNLLTMAMAVNAIPCL